MDYKEKIIALLNSQELSKEQKEKLESIFPALKESEDERIRKGLIEYFLHYPDHEITYYGLKSDSVIAWLEKQGAKVSAIEGFETEFERQVSGLIASAINKEHEYNQGYVKWTANALLNYAKHELEKQGEQKSIDDLTQQEAMDIAVAKCFEQGEQKLYVNDNAKEMFIKALECVEEQNNKGYKLTDCDKNSWWEDFKAYTSCIIEQKPAWSEEDKKVINFLLELIYEQDKISPQIPSYEKRKMMLSWLNSLKDRVQPKQEWSKKGLKIEGYENLSDYEKIFDDIADKYAHNKNQEGYNNSWYVKERAAEMLYHAKKELEKKESWSEEDVRNIQDIDSVLFYDKNLPEDTCMRLRNWLKSLRPQNRWKPTKQQLLELRHAISGCSFEVTILIELEEQLKKLL